MEATDFKPTRTTPSLLRIALVLGVLLFGNHCFGQEDTDEESETTEPIERSSGETTEDSETEESPNDSDDSENTTSQSTEEDSSAVQDISTEEETTMEDPPNDEETEESDDRVYEDFVPTENISEDIEIPFPVDI
ncbi:MAG: hypothetical protein F4X56_03020 [Gammaproteobacteria bacterium]|nr:hypothetical protein [Gammaproteobacteria bacterium]MYC24874.1 hypothetical protein [Gammaproteobacteria bacterium]